MVQGLKALAWCVHHSGSSMLHKSIAQASIKGSFPPRAGRSDQVLAYLEAGERPRSPINNMEIAVPYEKAGEALAVLRAHFLESRRFPLMPIHVRASKGGAQWLSPNYQRDVCWLELWQTPASEAMFKEVHTILARVPHRPHWGKETPATADDLRNQYDRWADFCRLRTEWDRGGVFLNGYLATFFEQRDEVPGAASARRNVQRASS
jgi:hypothetical protein